MYGKEEKSCPFDRFIPSRRLTDFERTYHEPTEEKTDSEFDIVMNASELSKNYKQRELCRELRKLTGIGERIFKISPFSNSDKCPPSTIRLWPCRPRKKPMIRDERILDLSEFNFGYRFSPIDWGPNDWLATSVGDKVLIGKSLDQPKVSTEILYEFGKDRATAVSWSPDGSYLACGSETGLILVWNAAKDGTILDDICCYRNSCYIAVIHWHPDGKIFAWGCSKGRLAIQSINKDVLLNIPKAHRGGILNLKYSPGGNYICSSGLDGFLRIWKGTSYNAYMQIEMGNPSRAIAWHPWRRGLLAIGEGPPAPGSLSLWNVNTAKLVFLRKLPQSAAITALEFNKETGELVFAQSLQGSRRGRKSDIFVLGGPNYVSDSIIGVHGAITALLWSADNSRLGTASSDETMRIWSFLKPKNRKRSFSQANEDLSFLALKKFNGVIR